LATEASRQAAHSMAEPRASSKNLARWCPCPLPFRFKITFRRFLGVFGGPEHPLALFLDDLQWADVGTLQLIEHLLTEPEVRYLLLIGAYRDNEVSASDPLHRTLHELRDTGVELREIALALAEERLLVFDGATAAWRWDLEQIRTRGFTENISELITDKLGRLSDATLQILKQLACLGSSAEMSTISLLSGESGQALDASVLEPVRAGLVSRLNGSLKFVHDRVQEAPMSSFRKLTAFPSTCGSADCFCSTHRPTKLRRPFLKS
jgi:predicted ATPase